MREIGVYRIDTKVGLSLLKGSDIDNSISELILSNCYLDI